MIKRIMMAVVLVFSPMNKYLKLLAVLSFFIAINIAAMQEKPKATITARIIPPSEVTVIPYNTASHKKSTRPGFASSGIMRLTLKHALTGDWAGHATSQYFVVNKTGRYKIEYSGIVDNQSNEEAKIEILVGHIYPPGLYENSSISASIPPGGHQTIKHSFTALLARSDDMFFNFIPDVYDISLSNFEVRITRI